MTRYELSLRREAPESEAASAAFVPLAEVAARIGVARTTVRDDLARTGSGGMHLLDIDGTEVPLALTSGAAVLPIELHASVAIKQRPPYFVDARLEPLRIEVAS